MPNNHTPTRPLSIAVGDSLSEGPLTQQQRDELVSRVRMMLTGAWSAELLIVPRETTNRVREMLKSCPVSPSEDYIRHQAERLHLHELFAPHPVACLRTPQGLAVLAAGVEQVMALLVDLRPGERSEMQIISLEPGTIRGL